MNGEDAMKKKQVFCLEREVRKGRRGSSDNIRLDWPTEIDIDAVLSMQST
jgi:hypothetical protein